MELLKDKINDLAKSPELLAELGVDALTKIWTQLEDRRQNLDQQLPTNDDDDTMSPEEAQEEINRLSRIKRKGAIDVTATDTQPQP